MLLKDYVSPNLNQTKTLTATYNVQQGEINNLNDAANDILNQCFVDTATWGLDLWEQFLGITTDISKPYDYRRSVIKSKLRGVGTVTVDLIKLVVNSYTNGDAAITENTAPYTFDIKFTSIKGIPPNLDDLKDVIEQIKPAHLAVTYTFMYNTWSKVSGYKWGDLSNKTWAQLQTM